MSKRTLGLALITYLPFKCCLQHPLAVYSIHSVRVSTRRKPIAINLIETFDVGLKEGFGRKAQRHAAARPIFP